MRTRDAAILIVPGLGNSGPEHWQSRWQNRLTTARRVEQDDWNAPEREIWKAQVLSAIEKATRPVILAAHSLGVVSAVDAALETPAGRIAGAFLVAPPDLDGQAIPPELDTWRPMPLVPLPFPSFLVASQNDPYCRFGRAELMAAAWRSLLLDAGDAGHLNEASGHGPWPEGLLLFARLMRNADT